MDPQTTNLESVTLQSEVGFKNGSPIVVPIPFSNPALGAGLSIGAGYLFKLDEGAETSFIGLGGMYSENESRAFGLATFVDTGTGWTFDLALAKADVRYDLYFNNFPVPIEQSGLLANMGLDYQLGEKVSVGAGMRYIETSIGLSTSTIPGELLPDIDLELLTLGGRLAWDTRDDTDYPTKGTRLGVSLNRAFAVSGASRSYNFASANLDFYWPVHADSVLAARVSTCGASSDAAFFDKCSIGFTDGFRGFSPTKYYDNRHFSAQAEYRLRLSERFGVVAFGGIGWTGNSYSSLSENGSKTAAGVGLRYRVSKKFPVDFSVDLSTNNESEDLLYIFVGQRF